jgi:hypothetical protein
MDFHAARGLFRGMKRAERRAWQIEQVSELQAIWLHTSEVF